MIDLRAAARALGGEVAGIGQVLCPAPGHSHRDRSLSVLFDPRATEGFVVNTFAAGDDPLTARDHVRARLGLEARVFSRSGEHSAPPRPAIELHQDEDEAPRQRRALTIWDEAREPQRTAVEHYLASRALELPDEVAGTVLRYHRACPFGGARTPAMVALVRNVRTDVPQAIHRTALSHEGRKGEVNGKVRLALGSLRGGAVKLTPDAEVTTCLGIGEGIETTLSLRRLPEFGASPIWSVLSAGGIAAFPVLPAIECLWIAVDDDPAGREASDLCADRWRRAGREVFLVRSTIAGADLNDIVREVRHG
ncbi:DUF7146 domain-containing protein [Methylobacterium aquaticum]|uniref:DUF7146 domain-containing protein n=1 Tax=Methylobacterium aquaticum TaxID=270351 RepID=UPI003D16306E